MLRGAQSSRLLLVAVAVALVLVLVALAYRPALHGTFVWDDHILAEADAAFRHVELRRLLTQGFWPDNALGDQRAPYFRPLVLLSLRFDVALGGTPVEFHFTNVFLHLVACALVAFTAVRLGARGGSAVVAALLWGLAPRLTESVAWISGRTDVLAGVLGLAALALSPDASAAPSLPRSRWVLGGRSLAAGLCLLGALLAKEVAIAFAAALVVAALSRPGRDRASGARALGYIGGPIALWLFLRSIALATKKGPEQALGAARRAVTVFETIERYAEMIVDGSRPQTSIGMIGETDTTRAVIGGIVVVVVVALVVRFRRRIPAGAWVALTLAVVAILPVLHVVPLALAGSVAADRLLYVPLMGLVLGGAVLANALRRRARVLAAPALVVAGVWFAATAQRAADYGDEARFWVVAAEQAHPRNVSARNALALVVQKADVVDLSCRLYERSNSALTNTQLAYLTAHKRTLESLVNCWALSGRYEDAVRLAEDLARRYPTSGRVFMGLGFARLHVRDFDGAASAFSQAMSLDNALTRTVDPILADLPRTRADAAALQPPIQQEKKLAWARFLANVGRPPEADAAYLDIVLNASTTPSTRQKAIDYLVFAGSLESAQKVVGLTHSDMRRHGLEEHIAERKADRDRVDAVRERIEQVARRAP